MGEYKEALQNNLYFAANFAYNGDDNKKLFRLSQLGERLAVLLVATNNVRSHAVERCELQDVLTCIREKCTIQSAGFRQHKMPSVI